MSEAAGVSSARAASMREVLPSTTKKRARGTPEGSVGERVVAYTPAKARVDADVLELEPEGPPGNRAEVEIAPLEQLWVRGPDVSGRGRRLRADQQLAPAEVALELGPELPASCRGLSGGGEQTKGHQSERESHHGGNLPTPSGA